MMKNTFELLYDDLITDFLPKDISTALPIHDFRTYNKRDISNINSIIIHHSATVSGTPQSFANYHVHTKNWPGIGYHYVLTPDNQVYQTNPLDIVSYHTRRQNNNSIGICLVGDFERNEPLDIQLVNLHILLKSLITMFPDANIYLHSDFANTNCPGAKFKSKFLSLITKLLYK